MRCRARSASCFRCSKVKWTAMSAATPPSRSVSASTARRAGVPANSGIRRTKMRKMGYPKNPWVFLKTQKTLNLNLNSYLKKNLNLSLKQKLKQNSYLNPYPKKNLSPSLPLPRQDIMRPRRRAHLLFQNKRGRERGRRSRSAAQPRSVLCRCFLRPSHAPRPHANGAGTRQRIW